MKQPQISVRTRLAGLLLSLALGLPALAYSLGAFQQTMYVWDTDPCPSIGTLPGAQTPMSAVLQGESDGSCAISSTGVRYGQGQCFLSVTDLGSGGGNGWSQTRSVNPAGSYGGSTLGMEWSLAGFLSLVSDGLGIRVQSGSGAIRRFTDNGNGTYSPTTFYKETLVADAPNNALVFTDTSGAQWAFNNFATSPTGQMKSYRDPGQNLTTLTYGTSGVSLGKVIQAQTVTVVAPDTITETWTYEYFLSGTWTGKLERVSLARSLNGGASTLVRKVEYSYYPTTTSNGPQNSLQWARIYNSAGVQIAAYYHRYGQSLADRGLLTHILFPQGYELAKAAPGMGSDTAIEQATSATLAPWAEVVYTYDADGRVLTSVAQGAGCGCGSSGGRGTYNFLYYDATHGYGDAVNVWKRRTVETLPDGNQRIVYLNGYGSVLLSSFKETATGKEWITSNTYDASNRMTSRANPSAVISYSEADPFLAVQVQAASGLISLFDFYSATDLPSGAVTGYRSTVRIKQGSGGTPVLQSTTKYTSLSNGSGLTIYPVLSSTAYRNEDGTGAIMTTNAYTTYTSTVQVKELVVTAPTVTTAQNGSNAATTTRVWSDVRGRATWTMDADGFINSTEYDPYSGALLKTTADVASVPPEPGWTVQGGTRLNLVSSYELDALGRVTKSTDPLGRINYTVYNDVTLETRVYAGWTGTAPTGPTQVSRNDRAGNYGETLTMSATPATSGGRPTGAEAISGIQSLGRTYRDTGGRTTHSDVYFDLTGVTYATLPNLGVQATGPALSLAGKNYYRTYVNYDAAGRQDRSLSLDGTITRTVFDALGRAKSSWVGTDDTPTTGDWSPVNTAGTNLIKTSETFYDENMTGGVGDGNVTTSKSFTAAGVSLDTVHEYDWRNRKLKSRGATNMGSYTVYDNLGRAVASETYASADFTYLPVELRSRSETKFDERGQTYQTIRHEVDPVTGWSVTIGDRLTSNTWYNKRGMTVKTRNPNGVFQKTIYDGAGRTTASYTSYQDNETLYADADDVVGDIVITESVPVYDAAGQVLSAASYQRTNAAPTNFTGPLSTGWTEANSRRTYSASWYDVGGRTTHTASYGRNAGLVFTWTSTTPTASDTVLVSRTLYDAAGRAFQTIDPAGRTQEQLFDLMGRGIKSIQNRADGVATETELDTDRTTEQVYDTSGRLWKTIAHNPKGAGLGVQAQVTQSVYGTDANQALPPLYRNDIKVAEIYPDSDDTFDPLAAAGSRLGDGIDATYDRFEYTFDYAGRRSTQKDPRGLVKTSAFDVMGRPLSEAVTTLPAGVDGAVLRIEPGYDDQSRRVTVTSFDAVSAGNIVNQVKYTFDAWGSETKCEQSHMGAVVVGTPSYQKAFADGVASGEAKYVRTTSLTYPNGRIVNVNYPTAGALGEKLSRVDSLSHPAGVTFAQYTYMGAGAIVKVAHSNVSGGLNYDLENGSTSAGNPTGWDDFGRIDDNRWKKNTGTTSFDRYFYTFDRVSNTKSRDNQVTTTTTLKDEYYARDGMDRVTSLRRGDLNAGKTDITGTPVFKEDFTLESTGNWRKFIQTSSGTVTLDQDRTHNAANELSGITGGSWIVPVHDKTGNMTQFPQAGAETVRQHATYDAWNRLTKVQADSGGVPGTTIAEYQYDGNHKRTVKLKPNGGNWDRRDYYYSCEWQVVEEREILATGNKTTLATVPKYQWVWDLRYQDAPILRDENKNAPDTSCIGTGDQRLYYTQDANFNTTALITTGGTVVERYIYTGLYGKVSVLNASWATQSATLYSNEVLYAGYRLDPETGLYQVRHRAFHSTMGRWLQRDPAGYHDGPNLYEYVTGNPTNRMDPMGLRAWWQDPQNHDVIVQRWIDGFRGDRSLLNVDWFRATLMGGGRFPHLGGGFTGKGSGTIIWGGMTTPMMACHAGLDAAEQRWKPEIKRIRDKGCMVTTLCPDQAQQDAENWPPLVAGYFKPDAENRLAAVIKVACRNDNDVARYATTAEHEWVHAYDWCIERSLDSHSCDKIACTEIRASGLANCKGEPSDQAYRACVLDNATRSLRHQYPNRHCGNTKVGWQSTIVGELMDRCLPARGATAIPPFPF